MTEILELAPKEDKTRRSPFLPGTKIQFAWDSTSLGWLKECPRKYQYSMIEQWRSRGNSVHLDFGLWYHDALESYDKWVAEGLSHEDALNETVRKCLELTWIKEVDQDTGEVIRDEAWDAGHPAKTRETLVRSVIWYLEQFGDSDAAKTVILANGKPAVELSFKLEMDFGPYQQRHDLDVGFVHNHKYQPYVLCGHLDRVVEFTGGYYVMDRKTSTSTISSSYFDQYEPDNQMDIYSFAAKVIYQTPVRGVIIDAVQIAVGFSRFSRGFTFRTEAQVEESINDMKVWFALAEQYAIAGHWPQNTKSCHHYGGCIFRRVCSKSPEIRHKFLETDFVKKEWNPLIPRN